MFNYFGSKSTLAKYYPKPIYDTIIEPFAGSAKYSLLYWQKDIILIEANKVIADIWKWLINEATEDIFTSLPTFNQGELIEYPNPIIRNIIALESHNADYRPAKSAGKFNNWKNSNSRQKFIRNLYKVKHWKIIHGDYSLAPDIEATWFIDPPYSYQFQNRNYSRELKPINYAQLANWCLSRKGQVIVCEDSCAKWLPFKPFVLLYSSSKYYNLEGIWTNDEDYMKNLKIII